MLKLLKSTGIAVFFIFALLSLNFLQAQEEITITTYYPSPYGVYREMRAQRMAVGDNYIRGGDYDWGDEIDDNAALVVEGNVGIGTTSPQAKLHISGTSGTDGIMFPDETVQTTAAAGFGSWTNIDSTGGTLVKDTIYRVTSDGFVLAMVLSTITEHILYGYTDSLNATTLVIVGKTSVSGPNGYGGITMPVRKGDYWRVSHPAAVTVRWLSIGSGTCVRQ